MDQPQNGGLVRTIPTGGLSVVFGTARWNTYVGMGVSVLVPLVPTLLNLTTE